MASNDLLHVFIFSFNRGPWLENCVNSIFDNFGFPFFITIIDDASDDEYTKLVLAELASKIDIEIGKKGESRLGGLYNNMQFALDLCQAKNIFFLQDDMQIVRKLHEEEVRDLERVSRRFEGNPFIHPCFLKGRNRSRDDRTVRPDENDDRFYTREWCGQDQGVYYSDVTISSLDRLIAADWRFESTEEKNEVSASQRWSKMKYWANPFVMWVPEPAIFRYRKGKSGASSGGGQRQEVIRFNYMSSSEALSLKARNLKTLPFAEDYLTTSKEVAKPWTFNAGSESWLQRKLRRIKRSLGK